VRRLAAGLLTAVVLAAVAAGGRLAGIEVWKWMLAGIGLALIALGGRRGRL